MLPLTFLKFLSITMLNFKSSVVFDKGLFGFRAGNPLVF